MPANFLHEFLEKKLLNNKTYTLPPRFVEIRLKMTQYAVSTEIPQPQSKRSERGLPR